MHVTSSTPLYVPKTTAPEEVALLVEEQAPALMRRLVPITRYGSEGERYLAALRRHTVQGLVTALLRGRWNRQVDARPFRRLGHCCSRAGVSLDDMTSAADEVAEAVRDELVVPAARAVESEFGVKAAEGAITHHCKVVDDFAREAYRQLLAAHVEVCGS